MGRRGRAKGLTRTVVQAARAAAQQADDQCAAIAQHVYQVARELKENPDPALPLDVIAPVTAAAENVAAGAARMAGLDATNEEVVREVAAYLVAGFREMAVMLDPEHFKAWQQQMDELERAGETRRSSAGDGGGPPLAGGPGLAADGGSGGGEPDSQPPGAAEGGAEGAPPAAGGGAD